MAGKKTVPSRRPSPKPRGKVVLEKLPPGLIDGLPEEDQKAISAIVGFPIRLLGYDDDGRLELEFVEANGTIHSIFVERQYVKVAKPSSRRLTNRRK